MPEPLPGGRAGRLRLIERVAAAERASGLLDRKRRLLLLEQRRLEERHSRTRRRFAEACAEADRWGLRVGVLGGAQAFSFASSAIEGRAQVTVTWANTMGVVHPDAARCELSELAPPALATATAALRPAVAAYRRALEAAVDHGVASSALRRVVAELTGTTTRQRALEHHLLPRLRRELAALELRLDEMEREDRVVSRWAKLRQADQREKSTRDPALRGPPE
jgi:V/A-type H+-transporting ATPase subunit D